MERVYRPVVKPWVSKGRVITKVKKKIKQLRGRIGGHIVRAAKKIGLDGRRSLVWPGRVGGKGEPAV